MIKETYSVSFAKFVVDSNSANFGLSYDGDLYTGRIFYNNDTGHDILFDNEKNISPKLRSKLTEILIAEYNFGSDMYKVKTIS